MLEHNAINPETGETMLVGVFEILPRGYWWISDMENEDWLKLIKKLRRKVTTPQGDNKITGS